MPRRSRRRPFWAALAAARARCSSRPGAVRPQGRRARPRRRPRATRATTTTTAGPAGTWSKAISVAANANLSVVTCTAPSSCIMGSTDGQTYRLFLDKVSALGPAVPSPSPQGVAYLSCGGLQLLRRRAQPEPGRVPRRVVVGAARHHRRPRRASRRSTAPGPRSASPSTAKGNSFAYDGSGWSGNLGAWGAANQISCVSPSFCVAAEGGPSVFNGRPGPSRATSTARASSTRSPAPRPRSASSSTATATS